MSKEIDIYASVDINIWNGHKTRIMSFSVDGVNYHDNTSRNSVDDEWNLNIRINKDDLEAIEEYVIIGDTREIEDEQ